jgi:hypothetical protein
VNTRLAACVLSRSCMVQTRMKLARTRRLMYRGCNSAGGGKSPRSRRFAVVSEPDRAMCNFELLHVRLQMSLHARLF